YVPAPTRRCEVPHTLCDSAPIGDRNGHGGSAAPVGEETRAPITGPLPHIYLSVGYPERSIPFYAAFFGALGYRRWDVPLPEWQGASPTRATWGLRYPNGARFDVEVRP